MIQGSNMDLYKGIMSISIHKIEYLMRELFPELNAAVSKQGQAPSGVTSFVWITMHFILQLVSVSLKFTIHLLAPHTFDFLFPTLKPLNAHLFACLFPTWYAIFPYFSITFSLARDFASYWKYSTWPCYSYT